MTYFNQFPTTFYEADSKDYLVTDILRRSKFTELYRNNTDLYTTYTVKDGERPETIAKNFYKAADLHWVILVFNEIHNQYFEFPMNTYEIQEFVKQKYGNDNTYLMIRHYEKDGRIVGFVKEFKEGVAWVPPEAPAVEGAYPVSFIEYEESLNEARREIKILRTELVATFIEQFRNSLNV